MKRIAIAGLLLGMAATIAPAAHAAEATGLVGVLACTDTFVNTTDVDAYVKCVV